MSFDRLTPYGSDFVLQDLKSMASESEFIDRPRPGLSRAALPLCGQGMVAAGRDLVDVRHRGDRHRGGAGAVASRRVATEQHRPDICGKVRRAELLIPLI